MVISVSLTGMSYTNAFDVRYTDIHYQTVIGSTSALCLNRYTSIRDVNSREILFPSLEWPIPRLDRDSIWTEYLPILVHLQSHGLA